MELRIVRMIDDTDLGAHSASWENKGLVKIVEIVQVSLPFAMWISRTKSLSEE